MSSLIIPKDGKIVCYARLALTDGVGKWQPGMVLELYPLDHKFNWGDHAHFFVVKVKLTEAQAGLVGMRKLKIPLDLFLSFESVEKYRANRPMEKEDYLANGEHPRLDQTVDGEIFGCLAPEEYWVEEIEEPDI